jgi:hypothetical protein
LFFLSWLFPRADQSHGLTINPAPEQLNKSQSRNLPSGKRSKDSLPPRLSAAKTWHPCLFRPESRSYGRVQGEATPVASSCFGMTLSFTLSPTAER